MATEKPPSSNPRGHYTIYSPEQKAEIGRYAAEHGNLKAVCAKFSAEYGIEVKESTARQFKKAYFMELSEGKNPEQITALRGKKRGRPSKVGGLNSPVSSIQKSVSAAVAAAGMMTAGNGESQQPVQYEQMVGEMAISTCITVSSLCVTFNGVVYKALWTPLDMKVFKEGGGSPITKCWFFILKVLMKMQNSYCRRFVFLNYFKRAQILSSWTIGIHESNTMSKILDTFKSREFSLLGVSANIERTF